MAKDFIALIVCHAKKPDGTVVRLVIWFPDMFKEKISIGHLKEFMEKVGQHNVESTRSKKGGNSCVVVDFRPESAEDFDESVSEIGKAIEEVFSIQSNLFALGGEDFSKFLKESGINEPTKTFH